MILSPGFTSGGNYSLELSGLFFSLPQTWRLGWSAAAASGGNVETENKVVRNRLEQPSWELAENSIDAGATHIEVIATVLGNRCLTLFTNLPQRSCARVFQQQRNWLYRRHLQFWRTCPSSREGTCGLSIYQSLVAATCSATEGEDTWISQQGPLEHTPR